MDKFMQDMDRAISDTIKELEGYTADSPDRPAGKQIANLQAKIHQVKALKAELGNLILGEITMRPKLCMSADEVDGLKKDPDDGEVAATEGIDTFKKGVNKVALTLYGSAPTPKQLFSSFQQAAAIGTIDSFYGDEHRASVRTIKEIALPIGITTTNIVPIHSSNPKSEKKKVLTLGELLPQPSSLPQLNPPRQSRHTATRSSSVNWYNASESIPSTRSYRRDNYSTQAMATGHWLTYNVAPSASNMSSPEAKRKQRDRALSFGEPQTALPKETVDAHNQAKDEALFRSAFSSFAPDIDNTGATVSTRTKNRVWWEKVGTNRFYSALGYAEPEVDEEPPPDTNGIFGEGVDHEMELFEEAVASWTPEELPAELRETEKKTKEPGTTQEIDEILNEISELLETLNSYQRVRNLSLATNARTTAGQNPQLTAMSGSPTSPSSAEFDVYEMLKAQLTLMVYSLPPFAVARLDGEKMAALNISTKIQVEGKTGKGTMEEDDISLKARQAANPAVHPRSGTGSSSLPPRSNPYAGTPAQRSTYAAAPASVSRQPSNYLPNQQYSNRPISSSHYYGNASSSAPTQQRAPMTSDRYSYAASQQYSQQAARASNSGYANGYRSPVTQSGASYSQQYTTPSQASAASIAYSQPQRPSQPGYQQRAMNSQAFGYVNTSAGRSASPQQPSSTYTPQQRSSYAANNATLHQQAPPTYNSHLSQYGGQATPSQQANGSTTDRTASQQTYLSANEQAALMTRQKAQIAEQQGQTPSRHTSSTPQPANGSYAGQSNGVSAAQHNGVTVEQVQ